MTSEHKQDRKARHINVRFDEEMYVALVRAAAREQLKTGKLVSVGELVRRAVEAIYGHGNTV